MLSKEDARKWVKALRSGDYKQGIGHLRDTRDRYCCMGVLCEVLGFESRHDDLVMTCYSIDGQWWHGTLPDERVSPVPREVLIDMNDHHGNTFDEIADYIERVMDID